MCEELRSHRSRTPILMLTARDTVEDRIRGLDIDADDYLPKPFDFKELLAGLRLGVRPDGSVMSPVMPYPAFNGMSDEDVTALVAYLRTLPAVARENQPHKLSIPLSSVGNRLWQWLFFTPTTPPPQASTDSIARGRYISEHVAHCQECHTPRTLWGTLDRSRDLAGNPSGVDGEVTPNITPDPETGVGKWSDDDMVSLLKSGFLPNMDNRLYSK